MTATYEFYEIVRIISLEKYGEEGIVTGRAQDGSGRWNYSVHMYSSGTSRYFKENELESTGKMSSREVLYDGTSIRVRTDPDTGEGFIVGPDAVK